MALAGLLYVITRPSSAHRKAKTNTAELSPSVRPETQAQILPIGWSRTDMLSIGRDILTVTTARPNVRRNEAAAACGLDRSSRPGFTGPPFAPERR